ncbi:protein naked cuticle [Thrips palmi]|uniref:Protein naked cuticle homolog n=1 Tax=Thrips palmi TaxID=161013 RepID=A0A6P8YCZ5_THRPL|nr:protein naked cuticle [Thrips palmi]
MHTWTTTTRVSQDAQDEPSAFGLTALSALTAPQPSSMAHIVKWWRTLGKTRFFNGYKQLSALQQDSHDGRSDTEELLLGGRPSPSPCPPCPEPPRESRESLPSAVPPPGQDLQGLKERERERTPSQERAARRERLPSPDREKDKEREKADKPQPQQPEQQPNRQINFEEFECDVSVEGGVDEAGQERQEFSFTLYDFDGHGKITKDDITGLVSTIYETLGASITVPHYGSKTIKVKLTVSPDKRHGGSKGATATYANTATYVNSGVTGSAAAADNAAEPQTTPPTRVRFKRDLNVTIQERRPLRVAAAAATAATVATAAANVANGCQSPHAKKRSSSMQRQELLQIIQANMEKNNLCFQTAKKSCAEKTGLEERRHSHSGVHPHHRRQKQKAPPPVSLSASASPQRIYDYATTPYYVNLADKGECPGDADTYRYVVCTPKHQPTYHNVPCRERGHNRSRSHDLTTNSNTHSHAHQHNHSHSHNPAAPLFRYTLLQEDTTSSVQAFHVRPSRSPAITRRARLPPTAVGHSGVGHTAVGHTSSPHHLKHRNREQDQARAMAQVVQWLEQEFSASLNTRTSAGVREVLINAKAQRTKSKAAAFAPVPEAPPPPAPSAPSAAPNAAPNAHSHSNSSRPDEEPSPSGPGVKQHEHHHVHEHIHHHYHHYQDTSPVLV